jgi:hypothetical protein
MRTKVLFLLLVVFAISCNENSSPLIEEEETNYNPFAIAPEKAKAEAMQLVFAGKPQSKSSENLTSDIQTIWRTLTISPSTSSSVSTRSQSEYTELVPVYVISLENGGEDAGFIVTVGDSRVLNRVLAFSDEGEWDLSSAGDFGDVFWGQADAYIASTISENEIDPCDNYTIYENVTENTKFVSDFRPIWGQDRPPYNDSVPVCISTTNMVAGCVAVAMGQIMAQHGRPLSGSYTHPQYNRTVNAQYNWTAMKASPNAQSLTTAGKSGVANILAQAGVKVGMSYGCTGSIAYDANVPQAFSQMGYTSSSLVAFNYSTIISNIDNYRPVYIRGNSNSNSNSSPGHAWVVEGYKTVYYEAINGRDCPDGTTEEIPVSSVSRYLYYNLGNNGTSNGYFYADLSNSVYRYSVYIIHNIHPN